MFQLLLTGEQATAQLRLEHLLEEVVLEFPSDPQVRGGWDGADPRAVVWTLAWEAAVLAVTCELRGMVGVGKVTSTGCGDGVESVSVPDSSLLMLSSWVTSSVASSSSLGVPWYWRALPILTISSISSWYVLPRSTLFCTLVRAETRARLMVSSLENGTVTKRRVDSYYTVMTHVSKQ